MSRLTDTLLGIVRRSGARTQHLFCWGAISRLLFVILLGCVYALPNLFPPDFALQIRAEASDAQLTQDIVDNAQRRRSTPPASI